MIVKLFFFVNSSSILYIYIYHFVDENFLRFCQSIAGVPILVVMTLRGPRNTFWGPMEQCENYDFELD